MPLKDVVCVKKNLKRIEDTNRDLLCNWQWMLNKNTPRYLPWISMWNSSDDWFLLVHGRGWPNSTRLIEKMWLSNLYQRIRPWKTTRFFARGNLSFYVVERDREYVAKVNAKSSRHFSDPKHSNLQETFEENEFYMMNDWTGKSLLKVFEKKNHNCDTMKCDD